MKLSFQIAVASVLGLLSLWFRSERDQAKLNAKATELKIVKHNRAVLIRAQKALQKSDMKSRESVKNEIKRIKDGDRDTFPVGW